MDIKHETTASSEERLIKADDRNRLKAEKLEEDLSPFEHAFTDILVWVEAPEAEKSGWRVHEQYRDLFACLTPRQIKSFLRERLLATTNGEKESPAILFLRELFHPLWKMRRDEPALFGMLALVAKAALELQKAAPRQDEAGEQGKLSGPASDLFYLQLQDATRKSSVVSDEDARACWPRKSEERALLLHLLSVAHDEEKQGEPIRKTGKPFAEWVRERLGEAPGGVGVAEQVSWFQDKVLARYQAGDKQALEWVAEYAERFLENHLQHFGASSAISLSNLAVLIDDAPGKEAPCDRLFRAAEKLARPGSRIPFYYAEFLLDVLEDETRSQRLDAEKKDIILHARAMLDKIKDTDIDKKDRLYRDILKHRLELAEKIGEDEGGDKMERMKKAWTVAKNHAAILLSGEREPSSRLNDLLDSLIGTGSASLQMKEPLQAMIWAAQVKAGKPGWPMAIQIANDLVGESNANSKEEKLGIGLNAALVADSALLAAGENERLAAIWSQSGSLLGQRLDKSAQSRIALAFLVSLIYGGGSQTYDRMAKTWERLGHGKGGLTPAEWVGLLDEELKPLVEEAMAATKNQTTVARVRDVVFGNEYPVIATPEALAENMGWEKETFAWAGNKRFGDAVAELAEKAGADGNQKKSA